METQDAIRTEEGEVMIPVKHSLSVGDVHIETNECSVDELIEKVKGIFKDKNISEYLITKRKRELQNKGYGIG